jgi:hypothetical protein
MKNQNIAVRTIFLALACFGLLPQMHAIVPPPDGCYPNYTTAEGCNALALIGNGLGNTAIGSYSLFSAGDSNYNTGVGAGALALTTAGADSNTAVGTGAMLLNTLGNANTAVGTNALLYNDIGNSNTAIGAGALTSNTTGNFNTATGGMALPTNSTGIYNTANGYQALFNNTTGHNNTASGGLTLLNNSGGSYNIALGDSAGEALTTGNFNIDIGNVGVAGESSTIRIGNSQNKTFIAGIRDVTTATAAIPVVISTQGQLGTMSSSRRFKKEIQPMDQTSETIHALKPVTFQYKSDNTGTRQFGLIAEEVAEVNPDLVARDKNGEIYTVRYEAVNAMLLNEFLKEHKKVEAQNRRIQEQEKMIMQLRNKMETAIAHLKEHDSEIQSMNDQLEPSKTAHRVAASER